uniref:Direct IAP-binding protein with low pI n=1 Tax=Esox lucius TaxID=8010 RepID=A0A6Q2YLH3_ESOLU
MATFRRGCFCLGLSYATNLVRFTRVLVRRQVMKLPTTTIRKNWLSLSTIGALCAVPFSQKHDGLSHGSLIRRASSLVTDSTNTFLSQTTLALVDSVTQYVKTIHSLVTLHKHYVASASKLTPEEEDSVWKVIVRQRHELSNLRKDVERFESNWMMAVNLSKLAAEAAYDAGADQASVMAQNSLQVAQSHVEQIRQLSLEAEKNLTDSKAESSQRIMLPSSTEEDDIPDAYLRED